MVIWNFPSSQTGEKKNSFWTIEGISLSVSLTAKMCLYSWPNVTLRRRSTGQPLGMFHITRLFQMTRTSHSLYSCSHAYKEGVGCVTDDLSCACVFWKHCMGWLFCWMTWASSTELLLIWKWCACRWLKRLFPLVVSELQK
jgi:hypothetical protein